MLLGKASRNKAEVVVAEDAARSNVIRRPSTGFLPNAAKRFNPESYANSGNIGRNPSLYS